MMPNQFDATGRDHVTVEASFTEHFFIPDVVMKSDTFQAVGPDGVSRPLTPTYFKDLTVMEADTPGDGTWRISSGERVGRTADAALVKGVWVFFDPEKGAPAGSSPVKMTSLTKSEVYVSRGKPSDKALAPTGKGLEFHALTHPNEIYAGQDARFELLLDGKPVAGQRISIRTTGQEEDDDGTKGPTATTDAQGRFAFKPATPGIYVAMTRYRVGPMGALPGRSFTYALTFDAAE
jgi:hypothetical protein